MRDEARLSRRQLLVGLLVIPLSLLPFLAYAGLTPEGRLLKDKAELALAPPELGSADGLLRAEARDAIPEYRDAVLPLVYHGVGSSASAEGRFSVSPERLAEHLRALRAAGAHFVTPEQVATAFAGGRRLPSRAVLLTFDDGRTDAMMWATPLLKQAKVPATMFVITGAAEDKAVYYADWNALERYDKGQWNLQSHTDALHVEVEAEGGKRLPALTALLPGESIAEYRTRIHRDLDRADAKLKAHTGHAPVAFAYPFGAHGAERTNDPAIEGALRREIGRRYRLAFDQDDQARIALATATSDRLALHRMSVGDWSGSTLLRRVAAAVDRTPFPGDELDVLPPELTDAVPEAVPQLPAPGGPATTVPSTAPPRPAPGVVAAGPRTVTAVSPTPARSGSVAAPPPTTAAPTPAPRPVTTSPPATAAPSPGKSGDAPAYGRDKAPGSPKKK